MAQTFTLIAIAAAVGAFARLLARKVVRHDAVNVTVKLDRSAPGAHLIWDIANAGTSPVKLDKLIVRGRGRDGPTETLPLGLPQRLDPQDRVLVPTDVDWSLLDARSIAVADADGREHVVPHRQLASVQEHLRQLTDRRVYTASARDFLFGATDMAFGVLILGLGFFMLMWVIATG